MSLFYGEIVVIRARDVELTLEEIAAAAGLHPELVARFVSFGLIEPVRVVAGRALFAAAAVPRLRAVERLRRDLGANLPSIGVIFGLLERIEVLERELSDRRFDGD